MCSIYSLWSIFDPEIDVPLSSVASQRGHFQPRSFQPQDLQWNHSKLNWA